MTGSEAGIGAAVGVGMTIGVEEEYHLADAETGALADAPQVVAAASRLLGGDAQGEITTSQLEVATPVCFSLAQVRIELVRLRQGAVAAAAEHGCTIIAAGTHPAGSWHEQRLTPRVRYLEMYERWGLLALQQVIAGCHVHVSVPDPDLAVRTLTRMRTDLPILIALTASSPYFEGMDTGHASYRTQWWARWPTTGSPEVLDSKTAYDEAVADLVAAEVISDASHLYWDARPSGRYPTIEVRSADSSPSVDDVVLHAALSRSLVRVAADEVLRDVAPDHPRPELVRAARWRAARYGLDDTLLDLRSRSLRPASELVRALLRRLRDDLEAAGEWDEVAALATQLVRRGSSASRQRRLAERSGGDLLVVARSLSRESSPPG